jgi:hypothetical protein
VEDHEWPSAAAIRPRKCTPSFGMSGYSPERRLPKLQMAGWDGEPHSLAKAARIAGFCRRRHFSPARFLHFGRMFVEKMFAIPLRSKVELLKRNPHTEFQPAAVELFSESSPLDPPTSSASTGSGVASNRLRHSPAACACLLPNSRFPSLNSGVVMLGAGEPFAVFPPLAFFFSSSFFLFSASAALTAAGVLRSQLLQV